MMVLIAALLLFTPAVCMVICIMQFNKLSARVDDVSRTMDKYIYDINHLRLREDAKIRDELEKEIDKKDNELIKMATELRNISTSLRSATSITEYNEKKEG